IFFMSLLNSRTPVWITGMQAKGALAIQQADLEPIPVGYLVVEPGMKVGKVGKATLIKQKEHRKAAAYALAAQYFGMRFVYLEAGSGATKPVPPEMVMAVSSAVDIPIIVGGGLKTPEAVVQRLVAGADIIVTGTVIEKDFEKLRKIISEINKFKRRS
ncbi:MAG: phosphoglycerol geranylgeranyltransferase, partial [Candidatus Aenigmarchaeota archaeon]|nr:phosphoglycerol geranylgeranyltransferase [Candidatus Aenigmarchaeota archaeon]